MSESRTASSSTERSSDSESAQRRRSIRESEAESQLPWYKRRSVRRAGLWAGCAVIGTAAVLSGIGVPIAFGAAVLTVAGTGAYSAYRAFDAGRKLYRKRQVQKDRSSEHRNGELSEADKVRQNEERMEAAGLAAGIGIGLVGIFVPPVALIAGIVGAALPFLTTIVPWEWKQHKLAKLKERDASVTAEDRLSDATTSTEELSIRGSSVTHSVSSRASSTSSIASGLGVSTDSLAKHQAYQKTTANAVRARSQSADGFDARHARVMESAGYGRKTFSMPPPRPSVVSQQTISKAPRPRM